MIAREMWECVALPSSVPAATLAPNVVSQTSEGQTEEPNVAPTFLMGLNSPAATQGSTPSSIPLTMPMSWILTPEQLETPLPAACELPILLDSLDTLPHLDIPPPTTVPASYHVQTPLHNREGNRSSPNLSPHSPSTPVPQSTLQDSPSSTPTCGILVPSLAPTRGSKPNEVQALGNGPTESNGELGVDNGQVSPLPIAQSHPEIDISNNEQDTSSDKPATETGLTHWPEWFIDDYTMLLKACMNDCWNDIVIPYSAMEAHLGSPTLQVSCLIFHRI